MARWRTVVFAMTLVGAMLPGATAGAQDVDEVVEFVTNFTAPCQATAIRPVILESPTSFDVQGGGGGTCGPDSSVTVLVCLDLNLVTVASTCETYTGTTSADGLTGKAPCTPGIWQSHVTVVSDDHAPATDHSLPLIVTTQCTLARP